MKCEVYPADDGGCGHYRLIWPARALRGDVEISRQRFALIEPTDAEVIVVQRPLYRIEYELIRHLKQHGHTIVVEIDDDFHALHPDNIVRRQFDDMHNPTWLMASCDLADLVTVTTPALAHRYGRHERVQVLPNLVPRRYLETPRPVSNTVKVGWSGSLNTHPDDLQVCGDGIARAIADTGATFTVVGTGQGVRKQLQLARPPIASGWVHLNNYPQALAHLDVGIVPLQPSPFNEAKSWLKGLEMAAVGVPFVASPTAEYRRLADLGAGEIAETPDDWHRLIRRLIADPAYRAQRAKAGRQVAAQLVIEDHAHHWYDAWANAVASQIAAAV